MIIVITALAVLSFSGCREADELEAGSREAEATLSQTEETIAELESVIAESRGTNSALKSENDALESEVEILTQQLEEMEQSYMLKYHIQAETPEIRACIVYDGVFYNDPRFEAEQGVNAENSYATVILQAAVTDMYTGRQSLWYLIRFEPLSSPCNNIGWVPAENVAEYCAENMTDILWPVTLYGP